MMKPENFTAEMGEILSTWGKPLKKTDGTPASVGLQVQFNRTFPAPRNKLDVLFDKLEEQAKSWTADNAPGLTHYSFLCGMLMGEYRALHSKLADFTPNATSGGERECQYETDNGPLTVHYDIDADDDEVGYVGGVTVNAVYANGMDIQDLLDSTMLDLIAEHCDEVAREEFADQKADAAIERYESRRDEVES